MQTSHSTGRPHQKATPDPVEYIEFLKIRKASMTATEVKVKLLVA